MIKLLVVDDSALMRRLLGEIFGHENDFEVHTARNGLEALDVLQSYAPDVITLDVHMPQMDGLECLDRIMLERPCPVVMVSSLTAAGADATLEALRLGAVDFVAKPDGAHGLHQHRRHAETQPAAQGTGPAPHQRRGARAPRAGRCDAGDVGTQRAGGGRWPGPGGHIHGRPPGAGGAAGAAAG